MPPTKIVLDTNDLLRCISRRSNYSIVLKKLFENEYELNVTTDILLEYEEKIAEIFSAETAELLIGALVDDKHFNELKTIGFPQLGILSLDKFKEILTNN